ncbi:MAG: hypothetical protein V8T45_04210 [Oscillospiraceae bacterium]
MERLVEWNCKEKNSALPKCIDEWGDTVNLEAICAQLATIYDIAVDMSLDRLKELVEADRDGRAIISPVKLYQTVLFARNPDREPDNVVETTVQKIICKNNGGVYMNFLATGCTKLPVILSAKPYSSPLNPP